MHVHMTSRLYNELIGYSTRSLPNEACGIILGTVNHKSAQDSEVHAIHFIPITNQAEHPTRQFLINPIELLTYISKQQTPPLVGLFHSHPTAAPIPSSEDLQTLWHSIPTHWILSLLAQDAPDLQIYQLKKTTTTTYHKLSFVIGQ